MVRDADQAHIDWTSAAGSGQVPVGWAAGREVTDEVADGLGGGRGGRGRGSPL